jgi:hypothetical protein
MNESPPTEAERARLADEPEEPQKENTQSLDRSQPRRDRLRSVSETLTQELDGLLEQSLQYPLECYHLVLAAACLTKARNLIDDLLLPERKRRWRSTE